MEIQDIMCIVDKYISMAISKVQVLRKMKWGNEGVETGNEEVETGMM